MHCIQLLTVKVSKRTVARTAGHGKVGGNTITENERLSGQHKKKKKKKTFIYTKRTHTQKKKKGKGKDGKKEKKEKGKTQRQINKRIVYTIGSARQNAVDRQGGERNR